MGGRVLVVGSVNVDLVITAARLPAPGESVTGGTFSRHMGGKGGNQAVAAARLGAEVSLIAALGADELGSEARRVLEAEGVDLTAVATVRDLATGVAIVVVGGDGENLIVVAGGANDSLSVDRVREALQTFAPGRGDVVLVGNEIPTTAAREALRLGREAGATTILNPAPAEGLDRSTFGLADVLTPNRRELVVLVAAERHRTGRSPHGDDPARAAASLLEPGPEGPGAGAILVSLGAAGALLARRGADPLPLAAPRAVAVDSVGAGDTLNGALAAALAEGRTLGEAARRAVAAATLSTTRGGAREGMPTKRELEAALAGGR
ncbi:MAG: ribokinase [Chloroflexota bacterium]|nr:ribokinase [Chloroflexota bacterium]